MVNDEGMLSQEEIDALLNIGSEENATTVAEDQEELTTIEIDTLGEIGNISFGSSATTLSTLLNQKVEITVPNVSLIARSELATSITFEPVSVQVNYVKGLTGTNVFIIKAKDAAIIADIMLGGDGTNPESELNEIHLSAVQEAMNQMMGTAATSMSTIFNTPVDISPPAVIDEAVDYREIFVEETYVKTSFTLKIGNLIDSNMMQLMPISFAKQIVNQLLGTDEPTHVTKDPIMMEKEQEQAQALIQRPIEPVMEEKVNIPNQIPINPVEDQKPQYIGNNHMSESVHVEEASFSNLEKVELNQNEHRNLNMLLDIPLNVTVELGRTKRTISDILDFSKGSIIELDKLAGEPVDILVNNKLVATGEVVVIDENFGVRVTDVVSKTDRIMNLK